MNFILGIYLGFMVSIILCAFLKVAKDGDRMKYKIINIGCDDATEAFFEFTEEQFAFLNNVFEELNKNSTYGCMPTIHIMKFAKKGGE